MGNIEHKAAEAFERRVQTATDAVCRLDPDAAAYRSRTQAWVRAALSADDAGAVDERNALRRALEDLRAGNVFGYDGVEEFAAAKLAEGAA